MLRKLTFITLALALVAGAAIFTGCSEESITTTDSETGKLGSADIKGSIDHHVGTPVATGPATGATVKLYKNDNYIKMDTVGLDGLYFLSYNNYGKGYYRIDVYYGCPCTPSTVFGDSYSWYYPGGSQHITENFDFYCD